MMTPPGECVICLTPVTNQSTLACCQQPCHAACVSHWKNPLEKPGHILGCPYCRQTIPLTVIEVTYAQLWKEDPEFVENVKRIWKNNPFWYGICTNQQGSKDGYWGELKDPYEPNRKTLYYLGYTKSQVIPRMKTCLSFQ